jgi:hypothetical protein
MSTALLIGVALLAVFVATFGANRFFGRSRRAIVVIGAFVTMVAIATVTQLRFHLRVYHFEVPNAMNKEQVAGRVKDGFSTKAFARAVRDLGGGDVTCEEFQAMLTFDLYSDLETVYAVRFATGNGWKRKHAEALAIADSLGASIQRTLRGSEQAGGANSRAAFGF